MNEPLKFPTPDNSDALESFLQKNRPVAPSGLAARLAKAALDPSVRRRIFWADVERSARFALAGAAAAAVLAAGLALGVLSQSEPALEDELTLDNVVRLAVAPNASLEQQLLGENR